MICNKACGEDVIDMVMSETAKFAESVVAPLNEVGDTVGQYMCNISVCKVTSLTGCKYVDPHTVITPPGYKDAYAQYTEGGWQGLGYPVEFGGQGMPQSMTLFHSEIMVMKTAFDGVHFQLIVFPLAGYCQLDLGNVPGKF